MSDMMYQFGPLQWEALYFRESGMEPACIDPHSVPGCGLIKPAPTASCFYAGPRENMT